MALAVPGAGLGVYAFKPSAKSLSYIDGTATPEMFQIQWAAVIDSFDIKN